MAASAAASSTVPRSPAAPEAVTAYPRERIPKHAVLAAGAFGKRATRRIPSVLDAGDTVFVTRGSVALGLALRHAGLGARDRVLLPAYHCVSMVEPVVWCGAQPVFYRILPDLSPDFAHLDELVAAGARALLVPHYFGFPQDMPRLRAYCDARHLVLIEDCAHAFFGACSGVPVGSFGDYAIASPWKFFPVVEGGCLVSARHVLSDVRLHGPGIAFQLKIPLNTLEQAFAYRRLPALRALLGPLLHAKDAMRSKARTARTRTKPSPDAGPQSTPEGFDPRAATRACSLAARAVIHAASYRRIAERRRAHYAMLERATRGLPGCRPLFASLPEGAVPQVFPLLVDAPHQLFPMLKREGVPIIRFGEFLWPAMSASHCEVSNDYSQRVFQFPCHQELRMDEIEWMAQRIRAGLAACASREPQATDRSAAR